MTLYESHMKKRDVDVERALRMRNKTNRLIFANSSRYWEENCREMTIEQAEKEVKK